MYHPNKHMTEQSSSNPFSLSNSELDPSCYFWFFVVKLTEIWCVEVFMCACMLPVIVLMKTQLISCSATDLQVWQVTYSLMYLLNTFSMCFCWNRPCKSTNQRSVLLLLLANQRTVSCIDTLMISWLLPSIAPLVPNSANRKRRRCLGCLWTNRRSVIRSCD